MSNKTQEKLAIIRQIIAQSPDDQLEKAVQNHENDPAPDSADGFSDNTFRKKTDTTAAVLAGGYASVSSRRRSDATEAASKGSSASVSSRRRSDTTAAAFEGSSANVSSRRRSDATDPKPVLPVSPPGEGLIQWRLPLLSLTVLPQPVMTLSLSPAGRAQSPGL